MLNTISAILNNGVSAVGDYESIQTVTLGSAQASVDFSSISNAYTHLQIRGIGLTTGTAVQCVLRVGNTTIDSGSNYSRHSLYGDGGAAAATGAATQTGVVIGGFAVGMNSTNPYAYVIDILDYKNVSKNKTVRCLSGTDRNGSGEIDFNSGAWLNTSAITNISIIASSSTFVANTQFALYGVK